jgi:K+-sensing histidine kinase KdpD
MQRAHLKSAEGHQRSGVKFEPEHYLLATALPVVACVVRVSFAAYLEPTYILFYPAVIVAAVVGGLGPGIWATLLSGLLAWY